MVLLLMELKIIYEGNVWSLTVQALCTRKTRNIFEGGCLLGAKVVSTVIPSITCEHRIMPRIIAELPIKKQGYAYRCTVVSLWTSPNDRR